MTLWADWLSNVWLLSRLTKRGELSLNHAYSRAYTPVLRNPNLFHHNTVRSSPVNYPAKYPANPAKYLPIPQETSNYLHSPSPYAPQSQYIVPSPLTYLPHSYPNRLTLPCSSLPSQFPFSSYSMPTISYAPTVSSKGLTIILIATLILVALDLVIVRPQRSRSEVRSSMVIHGIVNI